MRMNWGGEARREMGSRWGLNFLKYIYTYSFRGMTKLIYGVWLNTVYSTCSDFPRHLLSLRVILSREFVIAYEGREVGKEVVE